MESENVHWEKKDTYCMEIEKMKLKFIDKYDKTNYGEWRNDHFLKCSFLNYEQLKE